MGRKRKKQHPWDEHLVATVLIVAGIAILILLASVMSSTGKASFSGTVSPEDIISFENQKTVILEGDGRTKCTFACGREGMKAQASYLNGNPVENDQLIDGAYICSCIGIE